MDLIMTQLRQLKMAAMAKALELQRQNPHNYNGLSFEERLGLLVEQEQFSRDTTRLMRLRKEAGLRLRASAEELKYPARRGIRPEQLTPLQQGHHLNYGQNVLITGATGCGKTYLACALGEQACRQNKKVRYYRLGRLMEALKLGHADGSYLKQLSQLQKLDLLILDDWGLEGFKGKQISDLLDVIEDRYEQRSTVIVSQLPVSEWYGLMENPTVADALLDRLVHNAHRLELTGESQRKKSLAEPTEVS